MTAHTVTFLPQNVSVRVSDGTSLLAAARDNGLLVDSPCGGHGTCGSCQVRIPGDNPPPPTDEERAALTAERLEQGFRLACRVQVRSDLTVRLLHTGEIPRAKIAMLESERGSVEPDGAPRKVLFRPVEPTLKNLLIPSAEALRSALPPHLAGHPLPLEVARAFSAAVGHGMREATLLIDNDRLAGVESGDTRDHIMGAAVDIGTTTLALYLCDLSSGRLLASAGKANSQSAYGDDVMSRISYCFEKPDGLEQLRSLILRDLNELAHLACSRAGTSHSFIYRWTLAGNTTMQHLFFGFDPLLLGRAPYLPLVNGAVEFNPRSHGLEASPFASGMFLPTVAGHVGADTVAVALAARLDECAGLTLAVDLGTNGEIVLADRGRLICCSTAAGPAFEGARIHMGMRAETGALDAFRINLAGEPEFHVIGERPHARGICGSGLLDIISELRRAGVIDSTGRILPRGELPGSVSPALAGKLGEDEAGRGWFLLDEYEDAAGHFSLRLTQKDVRELQLASGAISSGIQMLLNVAGRQARDVERVLLTGAFGNYMQPVSALGVGLVRGIPLSRLSSVGNAAGVGARFALLSRAEQERACRIARRMEFVELASRPEWEETFTGSMYFPDPFPASLIQR